MEPKTIRESIAIYRARMETEFDTYSRSDNTGRYPYDNHLFALDANMKDITRILETSGQFKLNKKILTLKDRYRFDYFPDGHHFIVDDKNTFASSIAGEPDIEHIFPVKGWTGFTIHPEGYEKNTFIDATNVLEAVLNIAEKNNVAMITFHKNGVGKRHIVRHSLK
mgnify:FL=1